MTNDLPRVTYSNTNIDFGAVHGKFDQDLPAFEAAYLGKSYGAIVGEDRQYAGGTRTEEFSPFNTNLMIGAFPYAGPADVDRVMSAAAAQTAAWGNRAPAERIATIRKFSDMLRQRRFTLACAAIYEVAKSRLEAIGEAEESVDLAEFYANEWEANNGYVRPLSQQRDGEATESRLLPFGVFVVIAPFNFPIALSVNMMTAALTAGNCVVFKPAPGCSLSGRMIVEAALDAGVPAGVINVVYGDGPVGDALVKHRLADGVAFTGSHVVGMQLARHALSGAFAKPVIAEMGGKNPAYVTKNANVKIAAEGVARSAFGLQGQKCSACSVAYVDDAVYDEFVRALVDFTSKLRLGDPRDKTTFIGAVHNKRTVERFETVVQAARAEGKVILGGERATDTGLEKGFFLRPTIVEIPRASRLTQDEFFMPFLVLRRTPSLEAALAEGNAVQFGLAAGVYSEDRRDVDYFLANVKAGVVYANRASGATTGAWPGVQSFCGWKGSGVTNKGGFGPYFLPQFMREQSRTLMSPTG